MATKTPINRKQAEAYKREFFMLIRQGNYLTRTADVPTLDTHSARISLRRSYVNRVLMYRNIQGRLYV